MYASSTETATNRLPEKGKYYCIYWTVQLGSMPQRTILEEIFLLSAQLLTGNSINERWERLTLAEIDGWIGKSAENMRF